MERCNKCFQMKITPNSKCLCNFWSVKPEKQIKPIKKISDKKKERLKKEWSEWNFFKILFKKLEKKQKNICTICDKIVKENEVVPACFAHILPKWRYKEFRYFENNIWFVCSIDCHNELDKSVNVIKRKIWLIEVEQIIRDWKKLNIKNYLIKK